MENKPMNTAKINKTNNIKRIPTQLNYFNMMHKRTMLLKKHGNISRLLIITLIIWNIFLTCAVIPNSSPIPQFTDKENQLIMQLEEIPTEQLQFAPIGE